MKSMLTSLFAALFALSTAAAHATVYNSDDKDEAKNPTPTTEQQNDEDKDKKPEGEDSKS